MHQLPFAVSPPLGFLNTSQTSAWYATQRSGTPNLDAAPAPLTCCCKQGIYYSTRDTACRHKRSGGTVAMWASLVHNSHQQYSALGNTIPGNRQRQQPTVRYRKGLRPACQHCSLRSISASETWIAFFWFVESSWRRRDFCRFKSAATQCLREYSCEWLAAPVFRIYQRADGNRTCQAVVPAREAAALSIPVSVLDRYTDTVTSAMGATPTCSLTRDWNQSCCSIVFAVDLHTVLPSSLESR